MNELRSNWLAPQAPAERNRRRLTDRTSVAHIHEVDGLLDAGYTDVTVLDLAQSALDIARARYVEQSRRVNQSRRSYYLVSFTTVACRLQLMGAS